MDQSYECGYHYTEGSVEDRPGVNSLQSWMYPNFEKVIFELQRKWDENNVPLKIEIQDKRIKITHKTPEKKGKLPQLKLSSYLAFMLGYTGVVEQKGQYLRFDQNSEYLAPHEPKLFMDYCRKNHIKEIRNDEEVQLMFQKFSNLLEENNEKILNEIKSNKLKLKSVGRLRKEKEKLKKEKDLEIKDLMDRLDNNAIPIKNFDQCHDQMWKIKGKVSLVEFSETTNLENGDISRSVDVHMEDYSGKINILAFDRHAVSLNKLVTADNEYYVTKINDQKGITASINNNGYKIKIEKV